jgi:hypothetical protein
MLKSAWTECQHIRTDGQRRLSTLLWRPALRGWCKNPWR